ncbi:hypothetical protein PLEOSDRAFT_165752 [Pleurotus ostreatus PC15]|uniref:DUF6533 domain-containing protein n=1 Tax=Pleurotus ostreatus (strain PC15) TaxID=1137138 RepID=A0A067P117_PLEO1|nr:hypothetical protein PLEOSDRAFT_165752 [Pleurotus ostreatus PC15]
MSGTKMYRPSLEGLFELRQQQIYDYLTTFGDEVTYVWRRPKGMGTVLYVLNRYPAFIDLTSSLYHTVTPGRSQQQCTFFDKAEGLMMTMRVWSLWGSTRFMAITLIAPAEDITFHMSGCYRLGPTNEFVSFAVLMGFEAVKCLKHSQLRSSQLIYPSSLFDLFVRDGKT